MTGIDDLIDNITDTIVEKTVRRLKEEGLLDRKEEPRSTDAPRMAYGITEMARKMGTSPWNIRRWIKNGTLDGCYLDTGNTMLFNLDLFEKKIAENGKIVKKILRETEKCLYLRSYKIIKTL